MNEKQAKSIVDAYAQIDVIPSPEHEPPEPCFDDERNAQWAREQISRGNLWGWCQVKIRVTLPDPFGRSFSSYLGCCSYESKEDFMAPDGYYPHMVEEAKALAVKWLLSVAAVLCAHEEA